MKVNDLKRGTILVAMEDLDPQGATVHTGDRGVVFEPHDYYKDGAGPMVRWFNGGACNVYPGQVMVWSTGEVPT